MNKHLRLFQGTPLVLAILLSISPSVLSAGALNNKSLPDAIALWFQNKMAAESLLGKIGEWDTSDVTNLDSLFQNQAQFNEDISQWDVSKATSMKNTFAGCTYFNSPLNDWDVSSVTSMHGMFSGATYFNQDLNLWNTRQVADFSSTFKGASKFNALLHGWETGNAKSMEMMFYGATFFEDNHNSLQNWDVSAVTSMKGMFSGATRFQGDLSLWDPAMVESFSSMFAYAASFDPAGGLNDWDVSNVKIMDRMFYRATKFEAELCWDTLAADASGVEMLCGSSGSFDPDCSNTNVPSGSEECPEAYSEMEEDYEVRESGQADQQAKDEEEDSPARGGSGGIGAMNPGANGRDHPERTVDGIGEGEVVDRNSQVEEDRAEEPPSSGYIDFQLGPVVDVNAKPNGYPETVVAQSVQAASSARQTCVSSLLVLAAASIVNYCLI